MQTLKQKGFTLIELLVVIVIIGILATISVATFSGYFAKARDSERQAAVRNAATVLKTARAVESIDTFATATPPAGKTAITVATVLSTEGGFAVPAANQGHTYAYGFNSTALTTPASPVGDQFFFLVCSEETLGEYFIDGTNRAITDVATAHGTTPVCATDGSDVDPTNATVANYTLAAAS